VRASNALPKMGSGYELYSSYPLYAEFIRQQQKRVITA